MRCLYLLQPRGFCAGVHRAVDSLRILTEKEKGPISVLHELVHNEFVIEEFRKGGVRFVESPSEISEGIAVFSAHGVGIETEKECISRGLRICDTTCPLVKQIHHRLIELIESGVHVLLIGHAGHSEIIGTLGRTTRETPLITSPADAEALPLFKGRIAYLTQTTLSPEELTPILAVLMRRFPHIEGQGNICYATQNRQNAVRALKGRCERVIVVGSHKSSNSKRLQEVAEATVGDAILIGSAEELTPESVADIQSLAVTSGASTPESLVKAVVARLQSYGFPPPITLGFPEKPLSGK